MFPRFLKQIPAADRIPWRQKLAFGAGGSTSWLALELTTAVFWMPFFNIGLGLSPVALGTVLVVLRLWDCFIDPVIGNFSDNTRTRWGRRRPYLFVGAILTAVLYLFLWRLPKGLSDTQELIWVSGIGLLFFTACACWTMPYSALQMELTPNYDERTRLMAWTALFGKGFGLLGGWSLAIVTGPWFIDAATGKPDIIRGTQTFSWVIAALILVVGLLPAIVGRERYYKKEVVTQEKEPFWASIRECLFNRPLWYLIGIASFLMLGTAPVGILGQYINIYYVNGGRIADAAIITGWKATALVATGIACIPLWTWLGERFDKGAIVTAMILISMFGHLSYIFCLRPDLPYLQLIPAVFEAGAISAIWIFLPSMKADLADYDEIVTSRRREGALNAFFSWCVKIVGTCGTGVGAVLLQSTGFQAKVPAQPPEVLNKMYLLFVILPIAIWGVTLVFLRYYPLNRERMAEIRTELELRRGQL